MAHNPSIDVETTIVSICACFAIISSLGIIATYYLCPNWRRELKKIKKIMVLMSICTLIASSTSLIVSRNKSDVLCRIQGSLFQIFGIGALFFQSIMTMETAIYVSEAYTKRTGHGDQSVGGASSSNTFEIRLSMYVLGVALHGIISCILCNLNGWYEPLKEADYYCYLDDNKHTSFMNEVPIVLSLALMLVLNAYTWVCIVGLLKNLMPATLDDNSIYVALNANDPDAAGTASAGYMKTFYIYNKIKCYVAAANRLDPVGSRTIFRLVFTPLLYLIILIIPRLICAFFDQDRIGNTVSVCSLISAATINFITWVLVDSQAMDEWHRVNMDKFISIGRESQSSYGTHPPSIYDDGYDSDVFATTSALRRQLTDDSLSNSTNQPDDGNIHRISKFAHSHTMSSEESC